jgi:hypothetical protein
MIWRPRRRPLRAAGLRQHFFQSLLVGTMLVTSGARAQGNPEDPAFSSSEMQAFREHLDSIQKDQGADGADQALSEDDHARLLTQILQRGGPKGIYGTDDRKDVHNVRDPRVKTRIPAALALFREDQGEIETNPHGGIKVKSSTLGVLQRLCDGERFHNQVAGAYCSGVLIKDNMVATAGHCIREAHYDPENPAPFLKEIKFVFGYVTTSDTDPGRTEFPPERIFRAESVVAHKFDAGKGEDWAIVKLAAKVPASMAVPVTPISATRIADKRRVYVLGYPDGLPLKYAPGAWVRNNSATSFFVANLDTFGGNSGSPVFDSQTNALVGLLVSGGPDYLYSKKDKCYRPFPCPDTGCEGEQVMRIERVQFP